MAVSTSTPEYAVGPLGHAGGTHSFIGRSAVEVHPLQVALRRLLYLQQRVVDRITWYTSNASIWYWSNVGARDLEQLRERIDIGKNVGAFVEHVVEAEDAVSREHTIWMADRM